MGAAGVASTTSSASTSSAAVVGPTTSAKPVGVRRSSRTGASVRTSSPARRAAGNRPMPPSIPAKTGAPPAGPRVRAASPTSDGDAAPAGELRDGGPRGEQPRVAGVHAAQQRLDQPVDDLVAEPGGHQVAHRDVLAVGQGPARGLVPQPG